MFSPGKSLLTWRKHKSCYSFLNGKSRYGIIPRHPFQNKNHIPFCLSLTILRHPALTPFDVSAFFIPFFPFGCCFTAAAPRLQRSESDPFRSHGGIFLWLTTKPKPKRNGLNGNRRKKPSFGSWGWTKAPSSDCTTTIGASSTRIGGSMNPWWTWGTNFRTYPTFPRNCLSTTLPPSWIVWRTRECSKPCPTGTNSPWRSYFSGGRAFPTRKSPKRWEHQKQPCGRKSHG